MNISVTTFFVVNTLIMIYLRLCMLLVRILVNANCIPRQVLPEDTLDSAALRRRRRRRRVRRRVRVTFLCAL